MARSIKQWWKSAEPVQRQALAKKAKTTVPVLSHIVHGHRRGSAETAIRVWKASRGRITLHSVCPALRDLRL